ncbi:hypothetical protein BKA70DRAFT_1132938 [Coprinopsis sp. MPI-PUGE-AT-0042]|nr:hypothetical protein BKA70DRAFT_1132938 [Coprinopsis sp. MPI-PUGE-AT-0042]
MKFAIILAALLPFAAAQCVCTNNNNPGRWRDGRSPAGAVDVLTQANPCYRASGQGYLCATGNWNDYDCLKKYAHEQESWHQDWFLWSRINCGGMSLLMTAS